MRVRCVQMQVSRNIDDNVDKALRLAFGGAAAGVDAILFPELFATGHRLDELDWRAHGRDSATFARFAALARRHAVNLVLGSVAVADPRGVTNTCFALDRAGRIAAEYSKVHLFRPMAEHRCFTPGGRAGIFRLDGVTAAVVICYDLRFPELTRRLFVEAQPSVVFVPMAWPAPRTDVFRTLMRARAIENQCFMVSANRTGPSDGHEFDGYSMVADPTGGVLAELPQREGVLDVDIDLTLADRVRRLLPCLADRREEVYAAAVTAPS